MNSQIETRILLAVHISLSEEILRWVLIYNKFSNISRIKLWLWSGKLTKQVGSNPPDFYCPSGNMDKKIIICTD